MDASTSWHLGLSSLIAGGAFVHGYRKFKLRRPIDAIDLSFCILGGFFGLGPWVACYYGKGALPFEEIGLLTITYGGLGLFLAGLLCAKLVRPLAIYSGTERTSGLFHLFQNAGKVSFAAVGFFYGSAWAIRLFLAAKYGMSISGTVNEETLSNLPYSWFVISSISDVIAFACLLCGSGILFCDFQKSRRALLIVLPEFVWLFSQGRRWVLAFLIVMAIAFLASRRRILMRHLSATIITGLALLLWGFPAFLTFRAHYLSSFSSRHAVHDMLEAGRDVVGERAVQESQEGFRENMATRPLIVSFNLRISEAQQAHELMWGRCFFNTLLWSIPSVFYRNKQTLVPCEELIEEHYDLGFYDASSNWPAYAVADFGLPGAFIVGSLLGLLLAALERFALAEYCKNRMLGFCILGVTVNIALTVEETPVFVWGNLRSLLVVLILMKILTPMFSVGVGSHERRRRPSEQALANNCAGV